MNLDEFRSRLLREREELLTLSEGARNSRDPVSLDQSSVGRLSRMDAMQLQAMALESERRRQNRLKRIDAALQRIQEGDFGYCIRCGEPMVGRRLQLDPTTTCCIGCTRTGE